MFTCDCASVHNTYMCTHIYIYTHVHTHSKFGLKSLAVHIALIPVALMFGVPLVDPLSTIALPGMPWNNPGIDTLGRLCHPLCDSGKTPALCILAAVGEAGWLVGLFVNPGSCCVALNCP